MIRILALSLAGLAAAACGSVIVLSLGSTVDRYDHNRSRAMLIRGGEGVRAVRLTNEALAPQGSAAFQRIDPAGSRAVDGLPVANFTPTFTGVPLPLSAEPVAAGGG